MRRADAGRAGPRGGFEHYRAFPVDARQIETVLAARLMTVPTLSVEGGVAGDSLAGQLRSTTEDLRWWTSPKGIGHAWPKV